MSSVWPSSSSSSNEQTLENSGSLEALRCLTKSIDAALVLVRAGLLACSGRSSREDDLEALVEERHRLQPLEHGAGDELGALGGEDRGIGPERDRRARWRGRAWACRRRRPSCPAACRPWRTPGGSACRRGRPRAISRSDERVDDADADAVQTAGHLVAVAAELAAGVEHGEHDLGRALALVRTGRVRVDRDAAAVVVDPAAAVGEQRDADAGAVARHRLVDGVVDDLPDQVVETGQTGGADVHARPLADRVETLEDLDVLGAVVGGWLLGNWRGVGVGHAVPRSVQGRGAGGSGLPWMPDQGVDLASNRTSVSCTSGVSQRGSIAARKPSVDQGSLREPGAVRRTRRSRPTAGDDVADPASVASHR